MYMNSFCRVWLHFKKVSLLLGLSGACINRSPCSALQPLFVCMKWCAKWSDQFTGQIQLVSLIRKAEERL